MEQFNIRVMTAIPGIKKELQLPTPAKALGVLDFSVWPSGKPFFSLPIFFPFV
jgi:hypothetical protein